MTRKPIGRLWRVGVVALGCALALSLALPVAAQAIDTDPLALTGIIKDSDTGLPIEGVMAEAFDGVGYYSAYTTADGTYEIYAPAGTYDLAVWIENYYNEYAVAQVFDGVNPIVQDFALVPTPLAFQGTVTDKVTGAPIEYATVEAFDGITYYYAETGVDGTYEVRGPAGTYDLSVWLPDYERAYADNVLFGGTTVVQRDFELDLASVGIYGTVTDSATGMPVEGAVIHGFNLVTSDWDGTSTGPDGTYELHVAVGEYIVVVEAEDYQVAEATVEYDGTTATKKDISIAHQPLAFRGTITDFATGLPIEGVSIDAIDASTGLYSWGYTGADGTYEIYAPAATYDLYVSADGYKDASLAGAVFNGTTVLQKNFVLKQYPRAFYGTVTDVDTGDPIAGAEVYAGNGTGNDFWVFTDADGMYEIRGPAGVYEMNAQASGYEPASASAVNFGGTNAVLQDFAINQYPLAFYGTVTDVDTGDPIEGVELYAEGSLEYEMAFTGPDGTYEIHGPADTYGVIAYAEGYEPAESAGVVFNGVTAIKGDYKLRRLPVAYLPFSGTDRYQTTVLASMAAYPHGARTVVIATGANWPDALGGASLAGALDGPILLTPPTAVPMSVMNEINRLRATKAIIIGGPPAVSTAVENALKAKLGAANVERLAGGNRYDTANKVAARVITLAGADFSGDAFIATGMNFPDSLAASPIAYMGVRPIYLVSKTAAGVPSLGATVDRVAILGSVDAVNSAVESSLKTKLGVSNVVRLGGNTRYETAVAIATYGVDEVGLSWNGVAITTGANFPDALGGGVLQGKMGSVMVLTDPAKLSPATGSALTAARTSIHRVSYFGGLNAVSQNVRIAVAALLD
jgi:putative cell wall-binding protein